jgi:dipeptidyl aminopeptidase/acylaminoacyl peptidase
MKLIKLAFFCVLGMGYVQAQNMNGYQKPDKVLADMIEAPSTPSVLFDNRAEQMLILEKPGFPGIEELAASEFRVAGLRINPATNGQSRGAYFTGISIKNLKDKKETRITGAPENSRYSNVTWSVDNKQIAFLITGSEFIELWVADAMTGKARKIASNINAVFPGSVYQWKQGGILYKQVASGRGTQPVKNLVPSGPVVQENLGKKAPSRTYQDLLQNEYDEKVFDYYGTSQLVYNNLNNNLNGAEVIVIPPSIIRSFDFSPDGNQLMVTEIKRPYSYLVPYNYFPYQVNIYNKDGSLFKTVADIPLAENIPTGFDAVPTGRRSISWKADEPNTLFFVEALDGGDPNKQVDLRDNLYLLRPPFDKQELLFSTKTRYSGINWGPAGQALIREAWWKTRKEKVHFISQTKTPGAAADLLFDRSSEDTYTDPGNPMTIRNAYGRFVLWMPENDLIMQGEGYSAEGNRPFINRFNLKTRKITELWRSKAPYYEVPVSFYGFDLKQLVYRKESPTDQPNYHLKNLSSQKTEQITYFPDPTPALKGIGKQMLQYKRADGVNLTATLYLPAGYKKESGPLPVLLWAYPREFKSADAAGQVKNSPYEFNRINWGSPLYWVTRGYAVLDRADMPIIGEGNAEPNDTYIEQLVASAKAAIDELEKMGVGDPKRVGVGGHSYGAFMTANLLAHSDLFAAGIARSGAYNRTLTPFGFQAEERTLWEAPETYIKMSPFMYAHKIKEPLLMIHGEADNNSGTFPIQTERFYNAIKGHGGTTRFVLLPHESHGYAAKESIMHMMYEMDTWLDKYVKNKTVKQEEQMQKLKN